MQHHWTRSITPARTANGSHRSAPTLKLAALVLLGVLAFLGYSINVPLFFGAGLLFGPVAALLALLWLGPSAALLIVSVASGAVWLLWGQLDIFALFIAEIGAIALLRQRAHRAGRQPPPLAALDALFWLLLGAPITLSINGFVLGMDWVASGMIATKLALNGILNAAIAGLIVLAAAKLWRRRHNITLGRILFNVLVLTILVPTMLIAAWQDHVFKQQLETEYALRAKLTVATVVTELAKSLATGSGATGSEATSIDTPGAQTPAFGAVLEEFGRRLSRRLPADWQARFSLIEDPGTDPAESADRYAQPTSVAGLSIFRPRAHDTPRLTSWRGAEYQIKLPASLAPSDDLALALSFSADPLVEDLRRYTLGLLGALLALALLSLGVAAWLGSWLTGPLRQLVRATEQLPAAIAAAQPPPRLPRMSIHETDVLANTLNGMAESLYASFGQLEREKQRKGRQQALAAMQASLLSELLTGDDEAEFAEHLTDEIERLLPDHRSRLVRQGPEGGLAPLVQNARTSDATDRVLQPLLDQPAVVAACRETIATGAARPLPSLDSTLATTLVASGFVLPVLNQPMALIAVVAAAGSDDRPDAAFVREVLELGARLAGVALEALLLRRRHQVLIDALSQAQTGVIITERTDEDDLITYVNTGFEAMTGYSADEVIGRNCRFLQGQDRHQEARWQMRSALKDGDATSVIMRNYRKDGSRFWNALYISPMRDRNGRVTHYIGVQQDVTEALENMERLRISEAQLREAEERYRIMVENVEDLIVRVDAHGRFEFVSPSYCRTFGRSENELLGTRFMPLVHPDDRDASAAAMEALRTPPYSGTIEQRAQTTDGWRWFQWSDTAMRDTNGEVIGVIGVGRDITERKEAERALAEREAIATELLTLATRFVSVSDETIDSAIQEALAHVGTFIAADRAYLFRVDHETVTVTNTHEWCADGIASAREQNIDLPIARIPMLMDDLAAGRPVMIEQVTALDGGAWAEERRLLRAQQVQALLLAPVELDAGLSGFVGVETVDAPRRWSTAETQFLQLFANIFAAGEQRAHSIAALRRSNTRYDALARQSRTITWELDVDGRFRYISDVCKAVLGHTPEEMLGHDYADYIAEQDEPGERARAAEVLSRQEPFEDFVVPFRTHTGSYLWLSTDGAPVRGADGRLTGYHGITKDVTERQLALKRLAQSESRMTAIFNNAPIGIALIGRDRRPLMVNRALVKLLDRDAKELVEMRFEDFTHPEDQESGIHALNEILAGQRASYRSTKRYLQPDGELIWCDVRVTLLPAGAGRRPIPLAMVENITELHDALERQRAAEQELVEYAGQLESLIDLVNGSETYAEQVQALLQLARRALAAETAAVGLIDDDGSYRPSFASGREGTDANRVPVPGALVDAAALEPGSPVAVSSAPGAESGGTGSPAVGVLLKSTTPEGDQEQLLLTIQQPHSHHEPTLDVPQRQLLRLIVQRLAAVRYQHQLQLNLVQSRQRETIGHLASGVSHDFNNLLGVIDANLFFIAGDLDAQAGADTELGQVIAETRSALDQAKVITSGMLTMSRAGSVPLEQIDLSAAITELERILRQVLPQRIRLEIDLPNAPKAYSNQAFLQSALLNLALNARDAIRNEGTLAIGSRSLHWNAETPLHVGHLPAMDCIEIRVNDNGSGIPPELLQQIFEPLFSTKAQNRGHGLGLFMVREFVIRTRAGLRVESEPGHGTCFRILLPAEALADEAEAQPSPTRQPSGAGTAAATISGARVSRVLLVEDDRRVRDALSRLLRLEGLEIETADQGQDALERLKATGPHIDLVLSDIAMPVMDGLDLFTHLAERHPDLPVILMTGQQAHWEAPVDSRGAPAVILRKPIELSTLQAAIRDKLATPKH